MKSSSQSDTLSRGKRGLRLPDWIIRRLQDFSLRTVSKRDPDFVIGQSGNPYLLRWYVIPRNRLFNIYLHRVLRSDDDRALHDHPWLNCSIIVVGGYFEHVILAGGIEQRTRRVAGDITFRRGRSAHRLEMSNAVGATTLFITGPRWRQWGFHCPKAGWVHWKEFTAADEGADGAGRIGRGCGELDR